MRNLLLNATIGLSLLATSACSPERGVIGTEASPISTLPPFPTAESPQTGEVNPVMCLDNQWWNRHDVPYGGSVTIAIGNVFFTLSYPNTSSDEYVAILNYNYVTSEGIPINGNEPYAVLEDGLLQSRLTVGSSDATVYILIKERFPSNNENGDEPVPYYIPPNMDISNSSSGRPEGPKYDVILADRTDSPYLCGFNGPRADLPSTDN